MDGKDSAQEKGRGGRNVVRKEGAKQRFAVKTCCSSYMPWYVSASMTISVGEAMKVLSVESFRGKQEEAVEAVLSGCDVLYVFPTGCGKSFVYQVAALCTEGVTIIVCSLLGLLNEHVEKAASSGIPVIAACESTLDGCHNALEARIVYTTPEQLHTKSALCRYLDDNGKKVQRIVVDEAHDMI
jgi:superfamily II DNA helicase RecQ